MTENGNTKSKATKQLIMHYLLLRPGTQYTFYDKLRRNAIYNETFFNAAFINHSCMPNATHIYDKQHRTLLVMTLKDIQAGDEITVSYLGCLRVKRRQVLLDTLDFSCNCEYCHSPVLSKQLGELAIIDNLMRTINYDTALQYFNRFIELLDDIDAPMIFYYKTYGFMLDIAQQCNDPNWLYFYDKTLEYQKMVFVVSILAKINARMYVLKKVRLTFV